MPVEEDQLILMSGNPVLRVSDYQLLWCILSLPIHHLSAFFVKRRKTIFHTLWQHLIVCRVSCSGVTSSREPWRQPDLPPADAPFPSAATPWCSFIRAQLSIPLVTGKICCWLHH